MKQLSAFADVFTRKQMKEIAGDNTGNGGKLLN
jgi:hypothetical protein